MQKRMRKQLRKKAKEIRDTVVKTTEVGRWEEALYPDEVFIKSIKGKEDQDKEGD